MNDVLLHAGGVGQRGRPGPVLGAVPAGADGSVSPGPPAGVSAAAATWVGWLGRPAAEPVDDQSDDQHRGKAPGHLELAA